MEVDEEVKNRGKESTQCWHCKRQVGADDLERHRCLRSPSNSSVVGNQPGGAGQSSISFARGTYRKTEKKPVKLDLSRVSLCIESIHPLAYDNSPRSTITECAYRILVGMPKEYKDICVTAVIESVMRRSKIKEASKSSSSRKTASSTITRPEQLAEKPFGISSRESSPDRISGTCSHPYEELSQSTTATCHRLMNVSLSVIETKILVPSSRNPYRRKRGCLTNTSARGSQNELTGRHPTSC